MLPMPPFLLHDADMGTRYRRRCSIAPAGHTDTRFPACVVSAAAGRARWWIACPHSTAAAQRIPAANGRRFPPGGFAVMDRQSVDELKHRLGIVDYLSHYHWEPCRRTPGGQVGGLCPLHTETQPSFWVHPQKNLFFCHGCGRGGDLIRLVELYHGLTFGQALAHLRRHTGGAGLLQDAI